MIIDMHNHLVDKRFLTAEQYREIIKEVIEKEGISEEEAAEKVPPSFRDPEGKLLLQEMDRAGVEKSVIFPADWGIAQGEPEVSYYQQNVHYSEVADNSGGRLIFFVGIDPRREEAEDLFEECVKNRGAGGLKLHPVAGFDPGDKLCFPFYSRAVEYDVPVIFHCAPLEGAGLESEYSHPDRFRVVAEEFPFLKVVLAHSGGDWWKEAVQLATEYQNVFLEVSGWQQNVATPPKFLHLIQKLKMEVGVERIIFGSDGPFLHQEVPLWQWVEAFKKLPQMSEQNAIPFLEEEVLAILGSNAAELLKLTGEDEADVD